MDDCVCGHSEDKHNYRADVGGCLLSTCYCTEFEGIWKDDDRWLPGDDH